MHVEIDDGDALGAIFALRLARDDGHGVDEAESHGRGDLGMVPGRADGAEGIVGLAQQHRVERRQRAAQPGRDRRQRGRGDEGVGIELADAFGRAAIAQAGEIAPVMHQLGQHQIARLRLAPQQPVETGAAQRVRDGADAVGPLGMALRGHMIGKVRLADEQRGHMGLR